MITCGGQQKALIHDHHGALAELASVVLDHPELLEQPDPARDLARLLGVERLAGVARTRLDEAIARARRHIATTSASGPA